jgi:hypothetical protein
MTKQFNLNPKYAPYAKQLADRIKWGNPPMFVFVCVGGDAFKSAQHHNRDRDFSAMVLTPGQDPTSLIWPVADLPVVIEWDGPASEALIVELVKCLLRALAISATVWPTWVDSSAPIFDYDPSKPLGQRWIATREYIKTYYPKAAQI